MQNIAGNEMQLAREKACSETAVSTVSSPRPDAGKILVLGLGNDVHTDDAIGLAAVRELAQRLAGDGRVDVRETTEMGLALLDFIVGYERVILVDSIQTGRFPPGTVHELDDIGLTHLTGRTPHFLGVGETLALGQQLGLAMPRDVRILAIEVEDPFTLGTELTPSLQRALPGIVEKILAAVGEPAMATPTSALAGS